MMKVFLKEKFLFLLFSLGFLGVLIVSDFIWDKPYLKFAEVGMWAANLVLFLMATKRLRQQARQCEVCNLFVPLDGNEPSKLKPHCCYQKPKV